MSDTEMTGDDEPLIPGIDCTLGERTGSEDFDYRDPRCGCGCTLVWTAEDTGWHCPHCDLPAPDQLDALLDHLPAWKVRG